MAVASGFNLIKGTTNKHGVSNIQLSDQIKMCWFYVDKQTHMVKMVINITILNTTHSTHPQLEGENKGLSQQS